jgi:hypothetical protein
MFIQLRCTLVSEIEIHTELKRQSTAAARENAKFNETDK